MTPTFDAHGKDSTTFAPFVLQDCRSAEWKDVRLSFSDWDWLQAKVGGDSIDDYYLNGYGIQGLVQAARIGAGLEPSCEGMDLNSEGDTCYIHFTDFDQALITAKLASEMINDDATLRRTVAVAKENGLDDG
jgi:hypothetical protein